MRRSPFRRAVAVLAAALLVVACGDDDDPTTAADDTTAGEVTTTDRVLEDATADAAASTTTTTVPGLEGTVLEVAVTGGEVQGGGRTPVPLGEDVTIRVTSDVDDHVHLHGYDVLADVRAGETAELVFTADIPGVFEVELEDAGIPLLELEIS